MENEDGGSAFPQIQTETVGSRGNYRQETYSAGGMTLRDYFAAKAMQAFLTSPDFTDDQWMLGYAHDAYKMADAMLKARDA